jgi:FixJ family two-component response regulator
MSISEVSQITPVNDDDRFAWSELRPATMLQSKAVFVVDDDPSMLKGLNRLLRQYGFETVPFETASALKAHGDFDRAFCIVLDINLGDGSGIELRHQLANAGVDVPIIYITGNDSDATRAAAMASGCVAYLTKPFTAKSLMEPVERAAAGLT